jgi:hypothetical protein
MLKKKAPVHNIHDMSSSGYFVWIAPGKLITNPITKYRAAIHAQSTLLSSFVQPNSESPWHVPLWGRGEGEGDISLAEEW